MRISWIFESTKEMIMAGVLDSLIKSNGLKEDILNDENWQIAILTSKLINKDIYDSRADLFNAKRE
jgi:hypothetical protein